MKNIKCWLIGHDDIGTCIDPYDTHCYRCGYDWNYGEHVRSDLWLWLGLCNVRAFFRFGRFQRWLRCPDCKWWFGCHKDCFPF